MFKKIVLLLALSNTVLCNFDLVILHNNDIHGRFEETESNSGTCQEAHKNVSCFGGFARTAHLIREYRKEAENGLGPNVLYLNAGDTFIGTVWYTIFTWNITSAFMNLLRPDVQSLGNHEFDKGTDELYKYVSAINFPIIGGNVNFSQVPLLKDKIPKSVILNVNGTKVGIIGHVTTETIQISSPGNTIFSDEVQSVKEESERLDSLGIKVIIILGHSGYEKDQEIAEKVPLADIVVGGHTNTFLWNGPQPDTEAIAGPYPKVITQASGKKVPVVQAYAYTKYLGCLNLTFDNDGNLLNFSGQPVLLDHSIQQDKDALQLLEIYRPEINLVNNQTEGTLLVTLSNYQDICRHEECNFGNLVADALVLYKATLSPMVWSEAPIGLINGGGIRTTIVPQVGTKAVSRGELLAALPFGNQIVSLTLKGSDLWKTLELGARSNGETSNGEFLQVSGLRVVYDKSKPAMSRVVSLETRCGRCDVPTYTSIDLSKNYTIITISFLSDGYDGHYVLKENALDKKFEEQSDIDVLSWYFNSYSPVFAEVRERINFVESRSCSISTLLNPGIVILLVILLNVI